LTPAACSALGIPADHALHAVLAVGRRGTRRFTDVHPSCSGIDFTTTSKSTVMEDPF
jgi:hypothetical protein